MFESLEKDLAFYARLKEMSEAEGLAFLASPFGMESAALLKSLNPGSVKIASPELNYTSLLREIGSWGIDIILSSGVSRMEDLEEAVDLLGRDKLTLLHCVTSYPAPEDQYNLSVLPLLRRKLGVPVGISDHSMNPSLVPCVGMLYDAVMIEKHFTLSREEDGLDDPIALEPGDFRLMSDRVRELCSLDPGRRRGRLADWFPEEDIIAVQGHGRKTLAPSEEASYGRTNRSIHAVHSLEKGTPLTRDNCCIVRTEKILNPGMHPRFFEGIMGRIVKKTIPSGEGIREEDLEP